VTDRDDALAAVERRARDMLSDEGVISDHARLRTYECDGLAHYPSRRRWW
jgi:glycolate oxidase